MEQPSEPWGGRKWPGFLFLAEPGLEAKEELKGNVASSNSSLSKGSSVLPAPSSVRSVSRRGHLKTAVLI